MPSSSFAVDAQRMLPAELQARQQRLPRHSPPMKVASSTPSETALDPITSCSNWYQTIS